MTREEEIIDFAERIADNSEFFMYSDVKNAAISAAKWTDEHPNKDIVYTKQELRDMGFGFDLNGNICTPKEAYDRAEKYMQYRKQKLIEKVCIWLDNINTDNYMDSGIFQMSDLIMDLRKTMEE